MGDLSPLSSPINTPLILCSLAGIMVGINKKIIRIRCSVFISSNLPHIPKTVVKLYLLAVVLMYLFRAMIQILGLRNQKSRFVV